VLWWALDPPTSFSCTWSVDTAQHQIGGVYEFEGRTLQHWAKGQNYQQLFLGGAESTSGCLGRVSRSDGTSRSSTNVLTPLLGRAKGDVTDGDPFSFRTMYDGGQHERRTLALKGNITDLDGRPELASLVRRVYRTHGSGTVLMF
jgi:hypothetical protein